MILTTGPTGSGKTSTLYAALRLLNDPSVNIISIEDPVEYRIEGVTQMQVNKKAGLTFEKGLRSIVRQDPDILMVGKSATGDGGNRRTCRADGTPRPVDASHGECSVRAAPFDGHGYRSYLLADSLS